MYDWRKMTNEARESALTRRKALKLPWHSPPHLKYEGSVSFIFSGTCYEHVPVIGQHLERMYECETELLKLSEAIEVKVFAWCILPNHYHLLIRTDRIDDFKKRIGRYHGRTSRYWNLEDNCVGRKVWHNFFERPMKSRRHFWASMNYIHNNAVKHGYVTSWHDWIFSSARQFLEEVGREKAIEIWRECPVLDYGKDWDD